MGLVVVVSRWGQCLELNVLEELSVVALHLCQGLDESSSLLLELDSLELGLHRFALLVALVCGLSG